MDKCKYCKNVVRNDGVMVNMFNTKNMNLYAVIVMF